MSARNKKMPRVDGVPGIIDRVDVIRYLKEKTKSAHKAELYLQLRFKQTNMETVQTFAERNGWPKAMEALKNVYGEPIET